MARVWARGWNRLGEQTEFYGSTIKAIGHYDNSSGNKNNPRPSAAVSWSEQSWDEMMVGFFNLVFDAKMPIENLFADKKNPAGIAKN